MDSPEQKHDSIRAEYNTLLDAFYRGIARYQVPNIELYHWYHTVDLGEGVVTPGQYDYREAISHFPFPADMKGMTVLDIGSATGFFAFALESRGADVTSVELPSLHELDRFPGQSNRSLLNRLAEMRMPRSGHADPLLALSDAETYFYHLDGPFRLCHKLLHSKVRRVYSSIYSLDESEIRGRTFDYVVLGDILLHLFNPITALSVIQRYVGSRLVISQQLSPISSETPAIEYVGGASPEQDDISWFVPNFGFFRQFFLKLGFDSVEEVGRNTGYLRPSGYPYERAIILASRQA